MPTLTFEACSLGPALSVDAPEGGDLADLCDKHRAPVAFDCRSCSCATCRVELVEGEALVEPAADDELDLLEQMHEPPRRRLACQVKVKPGPGVLRLRFVGDQ